MSVVGANVWRGGATTIAVLVLTGCPAAVGGADAMTDAATPPFVDTGAEAAADTAAAAPHDARPLTCPPVDAARVPGQFGCGDMGRAACAAAGAESYPRAQTFTLCINSYAPSCIWASTCDITDAGTVVNCRCGGDLPCGPDQACASVDGGRPSCHCLIEP